MPYVLSYPRLMIQSVPMDKSNIARVTVHALGYGGEGIARDAGFVLFIPRALPGDVLDVRVVSQKKRYARAEIVGIVEPSPARREPGCDAFDQGCGGCQWLHLDYDEQCRRKSEIVSDSFKRIGRIETRVEECVKAERPYGCRNKFDLSYDSAGGLGLRVEKSKEILTLAECRMESTANLKAYRALKGLSLPKDITRVHLRNGTDGKAHLCLYKDTAGDASLRDLVQPLLDENVITGAAVKTKERLIHLSGDHSVTGDVAGFTYTIPIGAFFQTNYEQSGKLLSIVDEEVDAGPDDRILDLFCGLGFFSLFCGRSGCSVTGVESEPVAVAEAERMAAMHDIDAVFVRSGVGEYLAEMRGGRDRFSRVIIDPPRSGCGSGVVRGIAALDPDRIIYISCAPDTLARDCAVFSSCGYKVVRCRAIDMFPQTYHVEVVTTFLRE